LVTACTGTDGRGETAPFDPHSAIDARDDRPDHSPVSTFLRVARYRQMNNKILRRAAGAAIAVLLLSAVAVFADNAPADGNPDVIGNQTFIDLGQAHGGQVITRSVTFTLACDPASIRHVAPLTTIQLDLSSASAELDGEITATGTTIGPVPATWPLDGTGCPSPAPTLASNGPAIVTMKMPTVPGDNYTFTVMWSRNPSTNITKLSTISFQVDVLPNTPPHLNVPASQTVEATGPAGAVATFSATATDAEDSPPPTPTCGPASGSTFPLGDKTVSCSVTDSGGLTDSGSFHVVVVDTTDPSLVGMPADKTIRTNDPSGATLTYTKPTATDLVDPSPAVVCVPASGSTIPVGPTTVACTATDAAGNHASRSFHVDVVLNTAPHLTVPADKTAEATGPTGAVVTFSATATDAEDATAPVPTCAPASGSTFALGTATVNCSATDSDGLSDSGSFHVTVVDTTAPSLVGVPADITLTTNNPAGATLSYAKPGANDAVDPSPAVGCSPASGSTIPLGTTTVTCTATDASGNHRSATFSATVTLVSSVTWTAVWGEPIGLVGDAFVVNGSRSIPVKVEMFANGVEQTQGHGVLSIVGCDGGAAVEVALSSDGGRWNGKLDTSQLAGAGCYRVTAKLDGSAAGSFRLDLRGADPVSTPKGNKTKP
jgi:hypothetical protein